MSRINIAFGITEDWLDYMFVVMCSILSQACDDKYKFFIMCDIEIEKFEFKFSKVAKILSNIHPFEYEYIKMNNSDFKGVVHDARVGISAYYRLKLASLTDVDKIIYLDSDIVVLDNILSLWRYDINDYFIGAIEDKYSDLMGYRVGLSENDIYINSGVLLMNLKKIREENIENLFFEKLRLPNNDYSDQDVINDLCKEKILFLPLKYNLMLTTDDPSSFPKRRNEYNNSLKAPVILHYSIKPWILPVQYSEYWINYKNKLYK